MKKSIYGRCIRRWEVQFKTECDSKISAQWRKKHLRGYLRETAIIMADSMIYALAEDSAHRDYGQPGWSEEFCAWFDSRREDYKKQAFIHLSNSLSLDEIDDAIYAEMDEWNS